MLAITNRLSNKQVLYGAAFLIMLFLNLAPGVWLSYSGGVEHGYLFSDRRLQNIFMLIVFLLPSALCAVFIFGPRSKWRTFFLVTLVPVGCFFFMGAICELLRPWDEDRIPKPLQIGKVTAVIMHTEYNTRNVDHSGGCLLRLERYVLGNSLMEFKTLITVDPALNASLETLESGRKIKFTVPACDGYKEVVRIFDADWNSRSSRICERVSR